MGIFAVILLCVLVPLSYEVTVQMVRRGYDLSGDQMTRTDPFFGSIFNFFAVIEFPLLAGAALAYRRRKQVHKRLMLFANIMLMVPAITHFFGERHCRPEKGIGPIAFAGHHCHRLAPMHTMQSQQKRSCAECQHQQSQQQCLLPPRQPGKPPSLRIGRLQIVKDGHAGDCNSANIGEFASRRPKGKRKLLQSRSTAVVPAECDRPVSMRDGIGDIVS
jgi:hypothetical protein